MIHRKNLSNFFLITNVNMLIIMLVYSRCYYNLNFRPPTPYPLTQTSGKTSCN